MGTINKLENIEHQIMSLPIPDQIYLIERIAHRINSKHMKTKVKLNWNDLYGMGKGLWQDEDAQNYVNQAREERL